MNDRTIDERIEALRKRIDGIAGYDSDPLGQEAIEALAIIDELRKENLRLQDATLAKFNEQAARIAELEAENERLKAVMDAAGIGFAHRLPTSWIRGKG